MVGFSLFDRLKIDLKAEMDSKTEFKVRLDESIRMYKEAKNFAKKVENEVLENRIYRQVTCK